MTDLELAIAFFTRLKEKGFSLDFNHHAYGLVEDLSEPHNIVIEMNNDRGTTCIEFDFHADGSFYRASGYVDGDWQDEIDLRKY